MIFYYFKSKANMRDLPVRYYNVINYCYWWEEQ